jgi:hypothetical protein
MIDQRTLTEVAVFAMNQTELLEEKWNDEWEVWLGYKEYSVNLFFNGEGSPQATMYRSTENGIDTESAIDLF